MSYCRWSSDNWKCDLYCYEDVDGGWTTHIAVTKVVVDFLKPAERRPIGLPYDGKTYNDPTLKEFRARLAYLRGVGYSFPDYVFEKIDEEIAHESKTSIPAEKDTVTR